MYAVVFTGGECASNHDIKKLLDGYDREYVFFAADSGLEYFDSYCEWCAHGHFSKPRLSFITGDMDSITNKSLLEKYSNVPFARLNCDKDFTDTEVAVSNAWDYLSKNDFSPDRIILLGGGGGRLDHLLNIYDSFSTTVHPRIWLTKEEAVYFLKKNEKVCITGLSQSDKVSVLRLSSSRTKGDFKTNGLQWEYEVFRKEGVPSLSNKISSEAFENSSEVSICCQNAPCLVVVPHSAELIYLR